jgi:hypothetical protein
VGGLEHSGLTGKFRAAGVRIRRRSPLRCNVGDCKLHVSNVRFRHPSRHWKLVNNPFPAALLLPQVLR